MSSGDGFKRIVVKGREVLNHIPSHYEIKEDGSIRQLVTLEDINWGPIVHKEPDCLGYNRCKVMEPHTHGLACDKTCNECWGDCHTNCPANENPLGENK